ncbi:hypothetical protein Vau01_122450 [Virgisporangium aurantiacum]|uniref:Uncharacterized protein n=1 Tax=Virgisporangium aurantiacum TaxID=175570 RepID=A0A8J3ZI96_9ACTN|nr:hypothetical protein Vau01_122450 [Virgisporangium aurantiacum]
MLAAGIALALFTEVDPVALRSLRVAALRPPWHQLTIPYDLQAARAVVTQKYHGNQPLQRNAVFYVPRPARPLLRSAAGSCTALDKNRHTGSSAASPRSTLAVEDAAARYGITLPHRPVELLGLWQLRVRWSWLGERFHPDPPGRHRPAGLACHTAITPAEPRAPP